MKLGTLILSAFMLFGGSSALIGRQECEEEIRYRDAVSVAYDDTGSSATFDSVTINYSTKTLNTHTLAFRYPIYDFAPAEGACASVGGGNLIGFYDRYDENLIPDHSSGRVYGNTYLYSIEDDSVRDVIRQLYNYMGASPTGTTEKQFKNGLTDFCKDKGHSIAFSSCMQGGSLDYGKAQQYLDANQPVALFLSGYNVGNLSEQQNKDSLLYYVSPANHIMIAFGYKIYVYDGGNTYKYFSVASGIAGHASGLYNIDYKTKINNALAVNIT